MSNESSSRKPALPRLVAARFDLLLTTFVAFMLVARVLNDDRSAPDSRYSGSLNWSGAIAVLLILVAVALLIQRRRGVLPSLLAVLWLCVWTLVAVSTRGASTETLREGVREGSIVALAVVVCNARETLSVVTATRIVQLVGFAPALVALYQLATHSGMDVAGHLRANGTFAHPNSAAMFFSISAVASLWLCFDGHRRRIDAFLFTLFAAALIATFSIDGLVTIVAMLIVFGLLRPAAGRVKLIPVVLAALMMITFLATPLGSQRIAGESSTSLAAAEGEAPTSTFDWRLHRWKLLIPVWEHRPVVGQGLGTTTNIEGASLNQFTGALPHNEYARYLVETGVVGLVLLLSALSVLIQRLARERRLSGSKEAGTPNAATLALVVVIGCLINSLADNTLLNSPTCYAAALIVVSNLCGSAVAIRQPLVSRAG